MQVVIQTLCFNTSQGQYSIVKKMVIEDGKMDIYMLSKDGQWISVLGNKHIDLDIFKLPVESVELDT